jgi:glycosyltransferase involved in cell wall biosynthesis
MHKSLSIVIPVYNEEQLLERCLQSIAKQTVQPDQVIVVDNNSTDRTVEVAKRFPFVTLLHERKQGIVYARDTGFNAVTSDIICRIDGDTVLPTDWTYRVRRFFGSPHNKNHALTGGGYFYNVRLPKFNGWVQSQLVFRLNRLIIGHYILWGSNMAITRDQWYAVRNMVCLRDDIHEDLDLSFHLCDQGIKITYRAHLRIGAYVKRVFSDREHLHAHMDRWPQSLRVHGYKRWPLILSVNWLLWFVVQPLGFALEYISQLFGKKPLN